MPPPGRPHKTYCTILALLALASGCGGRSGLALFDAAVPPGEPLQLESDGHSTVCTVHPGGRLTCWGEIDQEGLFDGHDEFFGLPVQLRWQGPILDAAQVAPGAAGYGCYTTRTGVVRCWHRSLRFPGGVGDGSNGVLPESDYGPVEGLSNPREVAAGIMYACALLDSGRVWCWGSNDFGQCGADGGVRSAPPPPGVMGAVRTTLQPTPVRVDGLEDVVDIDAYSATTCAVTGDGHVLCWGYADNGETGAGVRGTPPESWRPSRVPGIEDAVSVEVGYQHVCALSRREGVVCWGAYLDGRDREVVGPTPVPDTEDVVQIASGQQLCMVTARHGVRCVDFWRDREIEGLPDVQRVVVGEEFACALDLINHVWCWGDGFLGGLANGEQGAHEDHGPAPIRGCTSDAECAGHTCDSTLEPPVCFVGD